MPVRPAWIVDFCRSLHVHVQPVTTSTRTASLCFNVHSRPPRPPRCFNVVAASTSTVIHVDLPVDLQLWRQPPRPRLRPTRSHVHEDLNPLLPSPPRPPRCFNVVAASGCRDARRRLKDTGRILTPCRPSGAANPPDHHTGSCIRLLRALENCVRRAAVCVTWYLPNPAYRPFGRPVDSKRVNGDAYGARTHHIWFGLALYHDTPPSHHSVRALQ